MPLETQEGIVAHHAAAVVGNLNEPLAPSLDIHPDPCGPGIECVFEQLLHHRSGPLHHLACGDLVGNLLGKNVNASMCDWMSDCSVNPVSQTRQVKAKGRGPSPRPIKGNDLPTYVIEQSMVT